MYVGENKERSIRHRKDISKRCASIETSMRTINISILSFLIISFAITPFSEKKGDGVITVM
jgi:hypothetical protein